MTATADLYLDSKEIIIHDLSIRYIKGSRSDIIYLCKINKYYGISGLKGILMIGNWRRWEIFLI